MEKADVVIDLAWGDSGKGKITHSLLKNNSYSHCLKIAGSANAGHTIYHQGVKYITHLIPSGVFYNIPSIIGTNCLVHPESFINELNDLQKKFDQNGVLVDLTNLVKIDQNTFIISQEHIEEDSKDTVIGTTKKGTGPAARDKYARISQQAKDIPCLKPFLIDSYQEFIKKDVRVICEGSQGVYLDPHLGTYPYVTSSHCTTASAILSGIPHNKLNKVYGCTKSYSTYVGNMKFQTDGEIFNQIRELGQEYGSTTGRPRQCNFLDLDLLQKAIFLTGTDILVVNKMDVMEKLDCWNLIVAGNVFNFKTKNRFEQAIRDVAGVKVVFSGTPEAIQL